MFNPAAPLCTVFTSTVNVSFFGREVIGGTEDDDDESGEEKHICDYIDAYSRSKKAAEGLVLSADDCKVPTTTSLVT